MTQIGGKFRDRFLRLIRIFFAEIPDCGEGIKKKMRLNLRKQDIDLKLRILCLLRIILLCLVVLDIEEHDHRGHR